MSHGKDTTKYLLKQFTKRNGIIMSDSELEEAAKKQTEKKTRKPRAKSRFVLLKTNNSSTADETYTPLGFGTTVKALRKEASKIGEGTYKIVCLHDNFIVKQTIQMELVKE